MKHAHYYLYLIFSMVGLSLWISSDQPKGLTWAAGDLLVQFKSGVPAAYAHALHERLGAVCLNPRPGVALVRVSPEQYLSALAAYRSDSAVAFVEPNYYTHVLAEANDTNYTNGNQWALHNSGQNGGTADADIDAPEAWDVATGDTVLVAVIDSGVDYDHPDLADNMWTNPGEIPANGVDDDGNGFVDDVRGWDFFDNDNDPDDAHGHGTRVAGIIAGVGNNSAGIAGVNWTARIMPLKFTNNSASGTVLTTVAAIDYAIKMGAKVINYSHKVPGWSTPLLEAIQRADSTGVLFVTSAGNDGTNNDTTPIYPASIPRDEGWGPNIIAVSATNRNDAMPPYANYGATSVELAAPGDAIYTTNIGGGYGTYNGTSYAAPFVSGVAALLLSAEPELDHLSVRQRILDNVDVIASLSGKVITGGRLNASKVLGPALFVGADGAVRSSYVLQALDAVSGRDTLRVEVSDADLNTSDTQIDVALVTIENRISGELETVQATETGVNTGIFQVRLPSIAGASGTDHDGLISLAPEDTLVVSYIDSLSSLGIVETRTDTTRIIGRFGGVRKGSSVSALDAHALLRMAALLEVPSALDTLRGDLDGDGEIGGYDASLVLQYVVGVIKRFPVQELAAADSLDVKNHPFLKPVFVARPVGLGEPVLQDDGSFLVPLQVAERGGILSGVLQIGVDFGIDVIDVVPGAGYEAFMMVHAPRPEGVRIAFAGAAPIGSGAGEVVWIRLQKRGDQTAQLSLDFAKLNGHYQELPLETVVLAASGDPPDFALHQNWPNPFNPSTSIRYELAESGRVILEVYNALGQHIRTLVSEHQEKGVHHVVWDGQDASGHQVGSGVYMMRMHAGAFTAMRKMLLLR